MKLKTLFLLSTLSVASFTVCAETRIEGKIHDLDLEANTFTIHDDDTDQLHVLNFTDKTKVVLNRREYGDLKQLSVGEEVVYKGGKIKKEQDLVSARVKEIDSENRLITYVDANSGRTKTLPFAPSATKVSGIDGLAVSDLRRGQRVLLEVVKR